MDGERLTEAIRGAQGGDPAAALWIVEQFGNRVFGFFYRTTGSRTDAEDLMQEVFVRFVRMIGSYHHDGRFEAWLFRIAANLGRDRARRGKKATPKVGGGSPYGNGPVAPRRGGVPRHSWVASGARVLT